MSKYTQTILTNMCLVENEKTGQVVVQHRSPDRYRWSGYAFPGGHIEEGESLHDAVVREVYEETGLTIQHPKLVGIKNWPWMMAVAIWFSAIRQPNFQEKSVPQRRERFPGWISPNCLSWN